MVVLLLFVMYFEEQVIDDFDVSDSAASTYVLEEATHPLSCVIESFESKFVLYVILITDAVMERILFVGVSNTTSHNTS